MSDSIIPAVLGWKNPEDDGMSLRLYALDAGPSPRWSKDSPTGRTVEVALSQRSPNYEGDRYLLVRVGNRFTDDEWLIGLVEQIRGLLTETQQKESG